jgi:dethiobiotin synthetase
VRGLFFTGTDTGVGKTVVMAAVARLLRDQGQAVHVCKPVATGAEWVSGQWISEDTRLLAEAEGDSEKWREITPWSFPDPVAPPVAARRCGQSLSLPEMVNAVRRRSRANSPVLVEGVGGLLCPLTESETIADLALELNLPLVIVTRRSLGTLNHTLLTLEAASARGMTVAGVVVNETTPPLGLADETNVEELGKRMREKILAVVPFQKNPQNALISSLAKVDWQALLESAPSTVFNE